jgi:hypothetical protein
LEKVIEYLRRANECRDLSNKALTPEIRSHFERLAAVWDKLADERTTFFIEPETAATNCARDNAAPGLRAALNAKPRA